MSAQRFHGKSSRAVLKEVRAALGEDAVIISNRTTASGVEILAMAGNAMDSLVESADSPAAKRTAEPRRQPAADEPESFEDYLRRAKRPEDVPPSATMLARATGRGQSARAAAEYASVFSAQLENPEPSPYDDDKAHVAAWGNSARGAQQFQGGRQAPVSRPGSVEKSRAQIVEVESDSHAAALAQGRDDIGSAGTDVVAELRSMKGLLQDQLSQIAWSDSTRRSPVQSRVLARLLHAGLSPVLARTLIEKMPPRTEDGVANEWISQALNQNLRVCRAGESLVDCGGIFALVGPTGVGKTTTTAKLAARAVMRFGAKNVGLITVDHYRVGAHEQLRSFGRMLGCPVHLAHDAESLNDLLNGMRGKHLILIDTIGVPQRDPKLNEQLSMLMGAGIERVLVLNASSQIETLEDVVSTWRGPRCNRAVITKIDEAVKLGGIVDVCIRHKLLLDSVANGQRVPEDLHAANAALLVHRALKVNSSPAFQMSDDELRIASIPSGVVVAVGAKRA